MEYLPVLIMEPIDPTDNIYVTPKTYHVDITNEYTELLNILTGLLYSDCWAMTVNDEILFSYDEPKPHREGVFDDLTRFQIAKNPHRILQKIQAAKTDSRVVLYMFKTGIWFMVIDYSAKDMTLSVQYCKTHEYNY